ncbi:DUF4844 domain-containing protein [Faecalibacter bovis]|uniref:DUF4844 domain-containing protein n=1 Tax=Faecalibacter bovis TaxID=2898187 RepID=A0ABX7XA23_9FLAO|nr:DUF4844 domain-containing protein [Faecalibacter bovis]QTV04751.1 DUF4844 domain-containing protein [Faecalibacter bovis]
MMNIKLLFTILLTSFSVLSMAQDSNKNEFQSFIKKEKFNSSVNGLSVQSLNQIVEKKLNRLASTFEFINKSKNVEDKHYLYAIKKFVDSMKPYETDLSINDKTIISNYIENLMDIVQLESSNGLLNQFVYGFDPIKNKKSHFKIEVAFL